MGQHDALFKALIATFPASFLRLAVPGLAERLELRRLHFRQAEFQVETPGGSRPRRPDLVAEVRERAPPKREALFHVEVEGQYRKSMPWRLYEYNQGLHRNRGVPVYSLVLYLNGGPPGMVRSTYTSLWLDEKVLAFHYTSFGLSGLDATEYLASSEPLAWALASLMQPGTFGSSAELRLACLRRIARNQKDPNTRLNEEGCFQLVNCIATYLESGVSAAEEHEALLSEQRHAEAKELIMTWAERIEAKGIETGWREGIEAGRQQGIEAGRQQGIEAGRQQGIEAGRQQGIEAGRREGLEVGRLEGMRDLVRQQLQARFDDHPDDLARRVAAIDSLEALERLAKQILVVRSADELSFD